MKLLIILAASVLLIGNVSEATAQSATGINFHQGTWDEVKAKAKAEGKLIFVDAYAVWCGPCKWMDANVFSNSSVGEYYNITFVNYKFDMEKGEGPAFARQYKVTAYPTLLFIDGDGKVVDEVKGSRSATDFIALGKKVAAKR
jgi:thioredoxin 1